MVLVKGSKKGGRRGRGRKGEEKVGRYFKGLLPVVFFFFFLSYPGMKRQIKPGRWHVQVPYTGRLVVRLKGAFYTSCGMLG